MGTFKNLALASLVALVMSVFSANVLASPPKPPLLAAADVVVTGKNWQLPESHFVSAKMPMHLVYPRPDNETSVSARHRRAYPGIEYRIPVSVQGGAYPFHYELLEGPPGMTIGQIYGQKDYGVVSWVPAGESGPHTVTVRITDQELTEQVATWEIKATRDGFVFVDPAADTNGDGTIDSPLNRFAEIHGDYYPGRGSLGNPGTTAFREMIVYLRAGTHQVADIPTPWISLSGRPRAFLGYPGESAEIDFTNGQFRDVSADFFIGGLTFRNAPDLNLLPGTYWSEVEGRTSGSPSWLYAEDGSWDMENGSRMFISFGRNHRMTWFEFEVKEARFRERHSTVHPSLVASGNQAMFFGPAVSNNNYREYLTFWGGRIQDQHGAIIHTYSSRYGVAEDLFALPSSGGPYTMHSRTALVFLKEQNTFWSVRRNRWTESALNTSADGALYLNLNNRSGSVDNMLMEAAYNLIHSVGNASGRVLNYNQGSNTVEGSNLWTYRNTFIGAVHGGDQLYTVTFENNVLMTPGGTYPSSGDRRTVKVAGQDLLDETSAWRQYLDDDYRLEGEYRAELLGIVGHEIAWP